MRIGAYFKSIRISKDWTQVQIATAIRPDFEHTLLWDFEDSDDADVDGWYVEDFKRYCHALGVVPADYARLSMKDLKGLKLEELLKKRREEMYLSIEQLSDRIGFDSAIIENLEKGDRSGVCVSVLKELSKELIIPLEALLELV